MCAVFGYRDCGGLGSRFGVDEEAVVGFEGHNQVRSTEPVVVVGDQRERELKHCNVEPSRWVIALYLCLGGLRHSIAGDRPLWTSNGGPVSQHPWIVWTFAALLAAATVIVAWNGSGVDWRLLIFGRIG